MEINAKQEWDNEEIVFVPLINEYFSVKVCPSHCQGVVYSVLTSLFKCIAHHLATLSHPDIADKQSSAASSSVLSLVS